MSHSNLSVSDSSSVASHTFSMDIEPDVQSNSRKYPSIGDYYKASSKDNSRAIQLQQGLSNYSSLVLGDDRICFSESILSATYRIPVEDKMAIESPSKDKTRHFRKREYQDALKKVGETEINRLERVMKDKLFQRSYATSSPFQVRKAFKFFDREQCLRIPIEGFTRALEFLGFQFSEQQNRALFARYDEHYTGEIDYMNFINTAMFYAAVEPDFGEAASTAPTNGTHEPGDAPDIDEKEVTLLQKAELRKVFNKVDREKKGALGRDDFELLLMAIGHNLSMHELDACFKDMGVEAGGVVPFELFVEWWTDSAGMEAIRKKRNARK